MISEAEIMSSMTTKDLVKMYTDLVIALSYDAPREPIMPNIEEAMKANFVLAFNELMRRLPVEK